MNSELDSPAEIRDREISEERIAQRKRDATIDAMPAGPDLDKLACEALGVESVPVVRWRCRKCKSPACSETIRHRDEHWELAETGQLAYPAISTDPAAMVVALPRLTCVTFVRQEEGTLVLVNRGMRIWQATGATAMEAFARAAAKNEGGVMDTKNDCQQCRFCFCECGEDIVCGHTESFKETIFGRGVNYARRPGSFCGPEGKLFEQRKTQ